MPTDNRTNEPTPDRVEAAAKAMHETGNPWFAAYGDWGAAGFEIKKAFRESARAALVAAQGAAPQAESDERIQAWERLIQHPVWRICFEEERPLIDSMMERLDDLAELEMTVNELSPAPALPSSGVDEDKLSEVLSEHVLGEPNGGTASWAWINCSCGHRIEIAGVTREHVLALGRMHRASAVAEWLKGQGGESRE